MKAVNILGIIIMSTCLFSCSGRYANLFEYPSQQKDGLVIIKRDFNDMIYYKDSENNLHMIEKLEGLLGIIEDVKWSPNGDYVLIESYGEGNQWISIYDAKAIKMYYSNDEINEYRYLDPYLHELTHIKWIANNKITFLSPGDFNQFDFESRRGKIDGEIFEDAPDVQWVWDIESDKFTKVP